MSLKLKGRIEESIINKIIADNAEQIGMLHREEGTVAGLLMMSGKVGSWEAAVIFGHRMMSTRRNWGCTGDIDAIDTDIYV